MTAPSVAAVDAGAPGHIAPYGMLCRTSMRVERFIDDLRDTWDELVAKSRNGSFLFFRDYMDYHRDRFDDHSLVVRGDRGAPVALLPANRRDNVLDSHGGLTFGSLVAAPSLTAGGTLAVFDALLSYLRQEGFETLRYRSMPHIYHRGPAEEDLYALVRNGAQIVHRTVLSVVDNRHPAATQERRRRGVRKARAADLRCRETADLATYWSLLSEVLWATYGARPVHSLAEIELLQRRFPRNIRLFGCFQDTTLVAGILVYESVTVARAQYIAASETGKRLAALDLLFDVLLHEVFADKPYFDLGTSESADRRGFNQGVLEFKESLGAHAITQDTYELRLR
jgi:Acetyltransferase (GNAT) domain